jgi:hypothetical protein
MHTCSVKLLSAYFDLCILSTKYKTNSFPTGLPVEGNLGKNLFWLILKPGYMSFLSFIGLQFCTMYERRASTQADVKTLPSGDLQAEFSE